jgi:hypothetical protein
LRARFDRIFRRRSGYARLDSLLERLGRNKDDLLRVLERPDIPLNANASENDIRALVTKRKSPAEPSATKGRDARDVMLGLAKTCMKLQDLYEGQSAVLPLYRRATKKRRTNSPSIAQPHSARIGLTRCACPDICPGYACNDFN